MATQTLLQRLDFLFCAMGGAWGRLRKEQIGLIGLWWAARHFVWLSVALAIIFLLGGSGGVIVGVFFLVIHGYKGARFVVEDERRKRNRAAAGAAAEAGTDAASGKIADEDSAIDVEMAPQDETGAGAGVAPA
eukprot:CAMPEP_0198427118 /NCGR_PEP_ID=MMETSP1452-20131203/5706_1 /TAXON_ID=1181717 /ORGANISM="Synchroma pusillum, Strain CCMP3072" /LENGTH=132 /DNA_ID=CAMNT_0044147493 /DNA_START=57 /DNA_END=455 /DNA_ORIENTATION=+